MDDTFLERKRKRQQRYLFLQTTSHRNDLFQRKAVELVFKLTILSQTLALYPIFKPDKGMHLNPASSNTLITLPRPSRVSRDSEIPYKKSAPAWLENTSASRMYFMTVLGLV